MKKNWFCSFLLVIALPSLVSAQHTFTTSWKSLRNYKAPNWYRDAKFGIFLHWGPQTVPENENGWYARQMYMQDSAEWGHTYDYHVKHYGHPSQFGFKDLIPLWKAEKWDPESLVKLFKRTGAKYIVPVATHHDNFDNYPSTYQPWNAVNMGPKKDIVGIWAATARKHGLRFGASSHSDRSWDWFHPSHGSDKRGQLKGISYDGNLKKEDGKGRWWEGYDPEDLYCRNHEYTEPPDSAYCIKWFNRTKELVDKYKPDLLWFDGPMPIICVAKECGENHAQIESYGMEIAAHFYNSSMKWHNGNNEAVLNIKSYGPGSIPDSAAVVLDIEKGQASTILAAPWQTDTSIPTYWFFDSTPPELSDTVLVHNFCDIVSKNGNLLLNVGLRADGTLPDDQLKVLESFGQWLKINGEAIFGTRPWKVYGEGPTVISGEHFQQNLEPFTADDIRFTSKDNIIYAMVLGAPSGKGIMIKSLNTNTGITKDKLSKVELLGSNKNVLWSLTDNGLSVMFRKEKPVTYAYVIKITMKKN